MKLASERAGRWLLENTLEGSCRWKSDQKFIRQAEGSHTSLRFRHVRCCCWVRSIKLSPTCLILRQPVDREWTSSKSKVVGWRAASWAALAFFRFVACRCRSRFCFRIFEAGERDGEDAKQSEAEGLVEDGVERVDR